jgi:hypothetical protein
LTLGDVLLAVVAVVLVIALFHGWGVATGF